MECNRQNFFVILDGFLPFYPPNNMKNQNFEKLRKAPEHIIILNKRTKNYDQIMYGSWDMVRGRFNCYFLKNQDIEKMKKMPGDIII